MRPISMMLLSVGIAGTVFAQLPPFPPSTPPGTNSPPSTNSVSPAPYYPLQHAEKHQSISVDSELMTWNDFLEYRKPALTFTAGMLNVEASEAATQASLAVASGYLHAEAFNTNGASTVLMGIRNNEPVYYQTHNLGAADTMRTDELWVGGSSGLNLNGANSTLGMWDGNEVLASHQEFGYRAVQQDTGERPATYDPHPTSVAGTLIASGVSSQAKGMAYEANLDAYGWKNDMAEMALAASEINSLKISNHSYARSCGWDIQYIAPYYYFFWFGEPSVDTYEDYKYGFYSADITKVIDEITYASPGYLPVWSSGNESTDNVTPEHHGFTQPVGHYVWNGSAYQWRTDLIHEADGGSDKFDNIPPQGAAKNNLTVGAIEKVIGGYAGRSSLVLADFSSCGPTDDGRIKPDVVAPGVNIYTSDNPANDAYHSVNGTSFSSPAVAGSLHLVQQLYADLFGTNRITLSSTLKGLAIHTADDGGNLGPDYKFGWGAFNALSAATLVSNDVASGVRAHIKEFFLPEGEHIEFPILASSSEPLKVTISWVDPPGPTLSPSLNSPTLTLVNDLDLRLVSPSGVTNFPWILDPTAPANLATTGDNFRDNVEQVYIENPEDGLYSVEVSYKGNLTNGYQTLSMLLSGNIPLDPGAFLVEQLEVAATTNTLQWGAIPGAFYQVQSCSDLTAGNWTDANIEISALSTNIVFDVATNETRSAVFYRIFESF